MLCWKVYSEKILTNRERVLKWKSNFVEDGEKLREKRWTCKVEDHFLAERENHRLQVFFSSDGDRISHGSCTFEIESRKCRMLYVTQNWVLADFQRETGWYRDSITSSLCRERSFFISQEIASYEIKMFRKNRAAAKKCHVAGSIRRRRRILRGKTLIR